MLHAQMLTMQTLRRACSTSQGVSQRALCTGSTLAPCQLSSLPGGSWLSKQRSACRSPSQTSTRLYCQVSLARHISAVLCLQGTTL